MNTFDVLWLAWPWIGFGGAIVIFILLFTDVLRSDKKRKRIFDPVWLSWLMVFAYLIHVLEEYGLHIVNGQFELITSFKAMGMDEMFGGIPIVFFPCINILLTWIALPIAAKICKKNPVIGLSGMGFLLFNGLTHLVGTFTMKLSIFENAGFFTGVFLFIPLFIWICYVHKKYKIFPRKGLLIAITSGILGHIILFTGYVANLLFGKIVLFIYLPFIAFSPIIISYILCKVFKIKLK